jgi:hypothetical protein
VSSPDARKRAKRSFASISAVFEKNFSVGHQPGRAVPAGPDLMVTVNPDEDHATAALALRHLGEVL